MEKKEVFCRIFIEGVNVHGVGYRPFLLRMARKLSIARFEADNIEDTVQKIEVLAGGDPESISQYIKTVKANHPRNALVSSITVDSNCPQHVLPIDEYDRILSAEQLDKIVSTGLLMLGKQDQMLGKQDDTIGSIKHMDAGITERFDRMDVKYDKMSDRMEKIDKTLERLADALIKIADNRR